MRSSRCSLIHTGWKSITCASSLKRAWLQELRMLQRHTRRPFCRVRAIAGMKSLSPVTNTFGGGGGDPGGAFIGRGGGGGRKTKVSGG